MTDKDLNQQIVDSLLADRRSERRWKIIRTCVWAFILIAYAILIFAPKTSDKDSDGLNKPHIALVRLNGAIMPGTDFSARKTLPLLNEAFRDKKAKGVILVINSPGGSPVQASIIHDRIELLKQRYHKKVIVVGEDTLASAAYLIATAADKIYVNQDTITGSIGVIMSGFGFVGTMQKLGVTRRVYSVGAFKDRLDPFKPATSEDKAKIYSVLNGVHQNFIEDVKQGRGNRLNGDPKELFSGDFWLGAEATKLGLVDGTADLWTVMKQQFHVTQYKDFSRRPSLVEMLFKGVKTMLNFKLLDNNPPLQSTLNY